NTSAHQPQRSRRFGNFRYHSRRKTDRLRPLETELQHCADRSAEMTGVTDPGSSGAPRPIAPGTKIGPYEIVGWLGAGGMGVVYRARDPRLGREVAIKLISESFAADATRLHRFEQEARASGQLNH